MPVYDYLCAECHTSFEKMMTLAEHDKTITCPKCGSNKVTQELSSFYAVTSKKSA